MDHSFYFKLSTLASGIALAPLVGGWDDWFTTLCWMLVIDYVTGIMVAVRLRSLSSKIGFSGILKKIAIILGVILATKLDALASGNAPFFRQAMIFYAIGTEGISIVENYNNLGFPLPKAVQQFFAQLKAKGEDAQKEE